MYGMYIDFFPYSLVEANCQSYGKLIDIKKSLIIKVQHSIEHYSGFT